MDKYNLEFPKDRKRFLKEVRNVLFENKGILNEEEGFSIFKSVYNNSKQHLDCEKIKAEVYYISASIRNVEVQLNITKDLKKWNYEQLKKLLKNFEEFLGEMKYQSTDPLVIENTLGDRYSIEEKYELPLNIAYSNKKQIEVEKRNGQIVFDFETYEPKGNEFKGWDYLIYQEGFIVETGKIDFYEKQFSIKLIKGYYKIVLMSETGSTFLSFFEIVINNFNESKIILNDNLFFEIQDLENVPNFVSKLEKNTRELVLSSLIRKIALDVLRPIEYEAFNATFGIDSGVATNNFDDLFLRGKNMYLSQANLIIRTNKQVKRFLAFSQNAKLFNIRYNQSIHF